MESLFEGEIKQKDLEIKEDRNSIKMSLLHILGFVYEIVLTSWEIPSHGAIHLSILNYKYFWLLLKKKNASLKVDINHISLTKTHWLSEREDRCLNYLYAQEK